LPPVNNDMYYTRLVRWVVSEWIKEPPPKPPPLSNIVGHTNSKHHI
jgi:hypothetical protein